MERMKSEAAMYRKLVERMTGKSLDDWEAIYARRRAKAKAEGKFERARLYSRREATALSQYFGTDNIVPTPDPNGCLCYRLPDLEPKTATGEPIILATEYHLRRE